MAEPSAAPAAPEPAPRPRLLERLLGRPPRLAAWLLAPPAASVVVDRVVRQQLVPTSSATTYLLGVLTSAVVWGLVLWAMALLHGHHRPRAARAVLLVVAVPLALLAFPVELAYFQYAHAYSSAHSLPLAWQLRSSLRSALVDSWATLLPGLAVAVVFVAGLDRIARHLAPGLRAAALHLPLMALTFLAMRALRDETWAQSMGGVPPDASLVGSLVGALSAHQEPWGFTVRKPMALPPLTPAARRTVVLVISESLRADVLASELDPARPSLLDESIPDRLGLRGMTAQGSSTMISCVSTWTGLPPDLDALTAHRAPLLFEIARAAGYRTAYVGSQRGDYLDLGTFLRVAGLDVHVHAEDLDPFAHDEFGARDELATARALDELARHPGPTFLVLHLSSTHYPYLVADDLSPHQPTSKVISAATRTALFNRYRNAVLLQERTLRDFFHQLRSLPAAADAVTLFVSDHGEQFAEHGTFTHTRTLFDEEVHVPGFVVAGPTALAPDQLSSLRAYRDVRVYNQDVSATVLDLLGLWDARPSLPLADRRTGRSLLRPPPPAEPVALLANRNGIWSVDQPVFGAMQGPRKVVGSESTPFVCFDTAADPAERRPLPPTACPAPLSAARAAFPFVP